MRANAQARAALDLARWLEGKLPQVLHPGLPSHPQHAIVRRQMKLAGATFSFKVDGATDAAKRERAMGVLNALQLIDISNNLGDAKTLMTHPASTTHSSISPETRAIMGVSEDMLRISVGLEDVEDLREDLAQALATIGL